MPWRNGGGETIEVAASPDGAGLDAFAWRVSMATVAADGPFSQFPGVDRTLSILAGEGLRLTVGDAAPVELDASSAPHGFPADVPTSATLLGGRVTDLNVMTRRAAWTHAVRRIRLSGAVDLAVDAATVLILCAAGAAHVGDVALQPMDALRIDGPGRSVALSADAAAIVYLIELWPAAGGGMSRISLQASAMSSASGRSSA